MKGPRGSPRGDSGLVALGRTPFCDVMAAFTAFTTYFLSFLSDHSFLGTAARISAPIEGVNVGDLRLKRETASWRENFDDSATDD